MKRPLPYSTQDINKADIRAVSRALRSQYLTQGPIVPAFEKEIARLCSARYAVAFSSGTSALHGAYAAAGIRDDDEVLIPALTFAATANAALYLGAKPVFVDCDASGNMDTKDAEKKITKKTKVIVPVDYAGNPANLSACRALAKKHGLIFIQDGAQSFGATYKGKPVGAQADMTMFSFHPVKSITTGEGGAIVTNNKKYYEFLTMFRTHGMTKDPQKLLDKKKAAWHQEMHVLGNNYRMTDIQAALGISQMERITSFIEKRRRAAEYYYSFLSKVPGLTLPRVDIESSAWHLFVVHVDPKIRDRVFTALRKAGIWVQVHYLPVYQHPYYREHGYKTTRCPATEMFSESAISISLFPDITKKEQEFVAKTLAVLVSKI